jgi:ribosomal protein S18 acetylase RimI-like enzyme
LSLELPEGITLREGEGRDILEMAEVVNDAFHEESFFVDRPRTQPLQLAEQFGFGHFLLAHQGRRLVALVFYELRDETGHIGMLAVRSDHQRRGVGRAIMRAAEQRLHAAGCNVAEVTVLSVRTALPPFYRKLGYREAGSGEHHQAHRHERTPLVQLIKMEKPLQAVR